MGTITTDTARCGSCCAREIPVVVVTTHAMAHDRELALAAGCDGFETKPIAFDRLLATVEALLDDR